MGPCMQSESDLQTPETVRPASGENKPAWPGTITTASFQGLYNVYVVDIGHGLTVRSVHAPIDLQRGSNVELMIDPDHVLVWKDDVTPVT